MNIDIKCPNCHTLFGKESEAEGWTLLSIKYRDLFRSFLKGSVYGPCRGCGEIVHWKSRRMIAK